MPEPTYTAEDIEAAHTLLQMYYSSSNSNHSSNSQTPVQSGTVSTPVQHHGTCTSCGSEQIVSTSSAQSAAVRQTLPHANQMVYKSTSGPSHGLPAVVGQTAEIASAPHMNQSQTPMHPPQNTNRPVSTSNANHPHAMNRAAKQMQPPQNRSHSVPPEHAIQSSTKIAQPQPRHATTTQNQALQEYLFRQQRIAGVAPQDMITIPEQRNGQSLLTQSQSGGQGSTPALVKFTREGAVLTPHIPPARFDGVLHSPQTPSPVQASAAPLPTPTRPALTSDPANHTIRQASQTITEIRNAAQMSSPESRIPRDEEGAGSKNPSRPIPPTRQNSSQSVTRNTSLLGYSVPRGEGNGGTSRSKSPVVDRSKDQHEQQNGLINQRATSTTSNQQSQSSDIAFADRESVITGNEPESEDIQSRPGFRYLDIPSALTGFPQLALMVIDRFGIDDFINTTMASKHFYLFVRGNPHTTITRVAFNHYAESARIYPYPCYRKYTLDVRCSRQTSNQEQDNTGDAVNKQPLLKWLKMLRFRENIVKELMGLFDKSGYTLTARCSAVLKKIWFLMDIPDNRRRLSTIKNKHLWSDTEIFHAVFIFAQIESRFTGHRVGTPRQSIRRVVMAQKTPLLLRNAMKGTTLRTHFEVLKEFMRWRYRPLPYEAGMYLFGVPPGEVGELQFEYYGTMGSRVRLQRPDELILKECSRRQLNVHHMYATAYLQSETDPSLPRNYAAEPEVPWLHEILAEARKKNTSDWLKDAVLDKY